MVRNLCSIPVCQPRCDLELVFDESAGGGDLGQQFTGEPGVIRPDEIGPLAQRIDLRVDRRARGSSKLESGAVRCRVGRLERRSGWRRVPDAPRRRGAERTRPLGPGERQLP
jgi:hypothetical protein